MFEPYSFNKNDLYSDSSTIELPLKTILGFLNNCVYSAQEKLPQIKEPKASSALVVIKVLMIYLKYLGIENSFSSEESSSEDDEEMDEGMMMAIKLSREQEEIDKMKRDNRDGKGALQNGMMSETDGFKKAMEMSMNDKPTAGGMDMQSMMSDTAGFQKILEMSKREEEARLAK